MYSRAHAAADLVNGYSETCYVGAQAMAVAVMPELREMGDEALSQRLRVTPCLASQEPDCQRCCQLMRPCEAAHGSMMQ